MAATKGSAARVAEELSRLGVDALVREMPSSTRTAAEAAAAIGCDVAQIVKSLVFRGVDTDRAILVLASGAGRVDEARLAEAAGEKVEQARADFVRERTGFAIGGVAPVGHSPQGRQGDLATYLDRRLFEWPEVWAAAGTPRSVFGTTPAELQRICGAEVVDLV